MELKFRSIDRWPHECSQNRKPAPFRASYVDTLELLERELRHLHATNVVVLADCDARDVRNDGRLRAEARLRTPGIVLVFDSSKGPLKFPCDRFTHWQHNLRAIALSLEALRQVDRYGVTRRSEQYTGWTVLPPACAATGAAEWATAEDAARWLIGIAAANCTPRDLFVPANLAIAYREAAKRAHPDAGGSSELMARVTAARDVLRIASNGGRRA